MSEIPEDVLAYATEIVAGELRKVPWINAPPDRIRAVAQAAVGAALHAAALAIREADLATIAGLRGVIANRERENEQLRTRLMARGDVAP